MAQLVKHRTGIAEFMGSNPVGASESRPQGIRFWCTGMDKLPVAVLVLVSTSRSLFTP